jgi:hypothetical protein
MTNKTSWTNWFAKSMSAGPL